MKSVRLSGVALLSLTITGCQGSKNFGPDDFSKVEKGMTEAQVYELLGKPKESIEALGIKRSFWQVADKYYTVSFDDGKVSAPLGPIDKQEYEDLKAFGGMMRNVNLNNDADPTQRDQAAPAVIQEYRETAESFTAAFDRDFFPATKY